MSQRIGFVLATGPGSDGGDAGASSSGGDLGQVVELALAARRRKLEVSVFVMHRGVLALAANPAAVAMLLDADCDVIGCATSADRHGVDLAAMGVVAGSQDDHAAITDARHRVLAFT